MQIQRDKAHHFECERVSEREIEIERLRGKLKESAQIIAGN